MKLGKFTEKAQEALQGAAELARESGQQAVEPQHLLLALVREEEGVARTLLERAGVSVQGLEPALVSVIERFPKVSGAGQPYMSSALQKALDQAEQEAERLKDEYISTEHLVLALADHKALKDMGATHDALLKALRQIRGSQRVTDQNPESKYQALEKYGRDLTKLAAEGKLDPVIGRDEEIRRVIQVLSRRTKNNPVLIGEPGVGKTAIVEGLAQRIVSKDIPESLRDRRVIALDMGALIAGAAYRGEFEERLKGVLKEVSEARDTIAILRGLKERYEVHHGVSIQDSALIAAATLSNRYIADRFLPDKAIDLVDEAASRLRMEVDSKPEAIDELDRRIVQLKIEREALKKESDPASRDRLEKLVKELGELEQRSAELTAQWRAEKDKLADAQKLKEQLDQARAELQILTRRRDWRRAGELT